MDLTENLNLIGYSMTENRQLKNIDEVAEFICKNGKHGDVTIKNNGEPFITTITNVQSNKELAKKVYDTIYVPEFSTEEFRAGQDPVCFEEFFNNDWTDEDSRKYYLDLLAKKDSAIELTQA